MPSVSVSFPTLLSKGFLNRQILRIRKLSERHIEDIAKETARVIKQKITERIERTGSTGNLANSFFAIKITDGWGVGDINFLNQQAPYWYWQNFGVAQSGRKVPPKSKGSFETGTPQPISAGGNSRWTQPGEFFINPSKPISPKNYIQATVAEIGSIVRSVVRRTRL